MKKFKSFFNGKYFIDGPFEFVLLRDYIRTRYSLSVNEQTFDHERGYYYSKYLGRLTCDPVTLKDVRVLINKYLHDHNHDNQ